jgi:hypothetical protein
MIRLSVAACLLLALSAGQVSFGQAPYASGVAPTPRQEAVFEPSVIPSSGFVPTAYFPSSRRYGAQEFRGYPADASASAENVCESSTPTQTALPQDMGAVAANCEDCEAAPASGLQLFFAYEAFRGLPDGGWENNGLNAGINYGHRLGYITERTGIAAQMGGSMGVYGWSGTDYRLRNQDQAATQGFLTYGLYRRATNESTWSAGLVQDWMLNSTFGVFAENPTLSQLRAQIGYEIGESDEVGLWGTVGVLGDTREVPGFGPTRWEAIDQLNAFWHHHWEYGSETMIWFGVPERSRLAGAGSLGDYIAGARVDSPLSERVAAYATITYMHPSASPGPAGSQEDEWSFGVGLSFYPGRNARAPSVSGRGELPLLPVASNGLFMVDTDHWY